LTYKHEKNFYIRSSEFTGELKCYKSILPNGGPCLYIRKSRVLESLKNCASQIIGKNIRFHGKNENSPLVGCYVDVVRNMEDKACVNARVNGKPVLLMVEELEKMCMRLTAVLRSGPIRMYKNEHVWSLNISEIQLDDLGPNEKGYFKVNKPNLKFL